MTIQEMQTYYGRRAPIYDTSMGYDEPSKVAVLAPAIDSLRRQLRGRSLLEIACGPGFWTRQLSDVAATITATDYNESMLEQARRKALDPRHVTLLVADAYDLSSVPGTFDGAFAVDWFAHVPRSRIAAFLEGLHERLHPGARVAFCDQLPRPASLTGVYDDEGNHLQERELPDGSRYWVIKHFFSDDEHREIFAPYADQLTIEQFPGCRRFVVGYDLSS